MQLPVDEEDDEEVVSVPEDLKVGSSSLLDSEPNHDCKGSGHDPTGSTWTS